MYRGWASGRGVGRVGGQKKFKNLAGLLADLPRRKRPKREERTIDRMAILPMAAMPTKNMTHSSAHAITYPQVTGDTDYSIQ